MARVVRCIEIRGGEGTLLFTLNVVEKEWGPEPSGTSKFKASPPKSERSQAGTANGESLITEAQKRYLFRILADQGIEQERAYQYLKENFGVAILKEVSKADASHMIKQLLGEQEGGNGNAPF